MSRWLRGEAQPSSIVETLSSSFSPLGLGGEMAKSSRGDTHLGSEWVEGQPIVGAEGGAIGDHPKLDL